MSELVTWRDRFFSAGRRGWDLAALVVIVAGFIGLSVKSFPQNSVTIDECGHLPAGLSYLREGDFRIEGFNSPLPRMAAALPLVFDERVQLPLARGWETGEIWTFHHDFMWANPSIYHDLFLKGRAVITGLGAAAVILAFLLGRQCFGKKSAVAAAFFLAFDPTFMAHSGLVTGDVGAALSFLAAVLALRGFLLKPGVGRGALAGLFIGLAVLSKFSLLILPVIMLALAAAVGWREPPARKQLALGLVAALLAGWATVNSIFQWQGVFRPLAEHQFKSRSFKQWSQRLPAKLPVPLAQPLIEGMDTTASLNENPPENYLLGKTYYGGKPHYFIVAFAVKTPLASLAFLGLGLAAIGARLRRGGREEWLLVLCAAGLVGYVSLFSNWNIGVRYLLPAYPFIYLIGSSWLSNHRSSGRLWVLWALVLGAGTLGSNLMAYPHYLPYFNRAAGGADRGHEILADSNLDWGQDLLRLREHLSQQPSPHLCFAYFGGVDPAIYGIEHEAPRELEQCETLAVSVQYLLGFHFQMATNGGLHRFERRRFSFLRHQKPEAVVGKTIWIYRQPLTENPGRPFPDPSSSPVSPSF